MPAPHRQDRQGGCGSKADSRTGAGEEMKRIVVILACALVGTGAIDSAPKETKSNIKPDAGGVVIAPGEGEISPGDELTLTFPNAMVSADKIDMGAQPCPFVSQPKIEGTFLWKSETEGVFTVT